jgi:hypothetical protein
MAEPETVVTVTCPECGRSPRAGETWRILFADIGEAVTYCPECAEREFVSDSLGTDARSRSSVQKNVGAGVGMPVVLAANAAGVPLNFRRFPCPKFSGSACL